MTDRRDFLKMSAGVAATSFLPGANPAIAQAHAGHAAGARPNIILILADDMGFSDIGCFGSEVSTPNLNRLASRGMRVNQYYNNPRCCPSRASTMTGLYSQQAGLGMMVADYGRYPFPGYAGILSSRTITIPEALKTVGYNTAMVGKWHLAPEDPKIGMGSWPLQRGFDKYWGIIAGASVYFKSTKLYEGNDPLPAPAESLYLTDLFAEHAAGYVAELAQEKKPFFLYTAFNAPHWPIQAPEEMIQKYASRYAGGWDELRAERHKKQIEMGLVDERWPLSPRDPRVPAWQNAQDKEWEMRRMAVYAAMIDRLDQGIGRIIDQVEKSGIADNTLIVFMSDNGGNWEEIAPRKRMIPDAAIAAHLHSPCEVGDACAGNVPGVMPGMMSGFQSIGIPWGNCANTPFRLYKHFAHEGGISSPFIACWPRVIKPTERPVNAVGHETDLMPTFLEVSGAKYPASVAAGPLPSLVGQSLVPLFNGGTRTRSPIYWEHEGNKAVRDGKWKLVSRFPDGWELFDMEADRTEQHDLAEAEPERAKHMAAMWDQWARDIGVQPWPMPQTPDVAERTGTMIVPAYLEQYQKDGSASQ
jgi:arylsulfatase A-like enzyme